MPLNNRQDVVEIMRDAGGELPDGFELLRMAQLGFEIELLGDVRPVAMDDLTGDDGKERPGKGAAVDLDHHRRFGLTQEKTFTGDRGSGGWKDGLGRGGFERFCHLARG